MLGGAVWGGTELENGGRNAPKMVSKLPNPGVVGRPALLLELHLKVTQLVRAGLDVVSGWAMTWHTPQQRGDIESQVPVSTNPPPPRAHVHPHPPTAIPT